MREFMVAWFPRNFCFSSAKLHEATILHLLNFKCLQFKTILISKWHIWGWVACLGLWHYCILSVGQSYTKRSIQYSEWGFRLILELQVTEGPRLVGFLAVTQPLLPFCSPYDLNSSWLIWGLRVPTLAFPLQLFPSILTLSSSWDLR